MATGASRKGRQPTSNERFDFEGGPVHGLASRQRPDYGKEAGRRIRDPGVVTCTAGSGNLHTNPALTKDDPVSSTLCLPAGFAIPPGSFALGYSSTITETSAKPSNGSHEELGQSTSASRRSVQACGPTHTPVNWGTTNEAQHDLQDPRVGAQGPEDDHEGLPQRRRAAASARVRMRIRLPAGLRRLGSYRLRREQPEDLDGHRHAPTNGPWNW